MISAESYSKDWILDVTQKQFPDTNNVLAERVIYALTLLEKLKESGFEFVFKGGTALLLSMGGLDRFSIDIDVVMPDKPKDINARLSAIGESGVFKKFEEDERENRLDVKKGHYKFYFDSVIQKGRLPVVLDVIFDKPTYLQTLALPLACPFVKTGGREVVITVPTLEGLMSDKLTTLASDTVGISFGGDNRLQIAKQLYDVARLFDQVKDFEKVRAELERLVPVEARYKKIKNPGVDAILDECFDFSLVAASRGEHKPDRHKEIYGGAAGLKSYLLKKIAVDEVMLWAGKIAYASRLLRTPGSAPAEKFRLDIDLAKWKITDRRYYGLNRIKKSYPEGYFYWHHAIRSLAGDGAVRV